MNDVIIETKSGSKSNIGLITLNRPKVLNALNFNMIECITAALLEWQNDDSISAVVIRGTGDKAFCAGGDIKSLYTNGQQNPEHCMQFFYHEYRLNTLIKNYTKPYIALMHGVTMGGGIGVSVHGKHRVSAHNLMFAMPESSIGFFTDIGGSYFLSRCRDNTGLYLALTGEKINCIDAKYINLVDHILESDNYSDSFDQIIQELTNHELDNYKVSDILSDHSIQCDNTKLPSHLETKIPTNLLYNSDLIAKVFDYTSLEQIYNNLEKLDHSHEASTTEWSSHTIKSLRSKSQTSLLVILEQLKRGMNLSFEDCMRMEYAMAYGFLTNHDMYEGIRAVLIDKDNKPNWNRIDLNIKDNNLYNDYFDNKYSNVLELS